MACIHTNNREGGLWASLEVDRWLDSDRNLNLVICVRAPKGVLFNLIHQGASDSIKA